MSGLEDGNSWADMKPLPKASGAIVKLSLLPLLGQGEFYWLFYPCLLYAQMMVI